MCAPEASSIPVTHVPSSHQLQGLESVGSVGSGKSFAYLKLPALWALGTGTQTNAHGTGGH